MSNQETYREAIEELEEIVSQIENEQVDVDILTEKVKRATYLIKLCKTKLRATEEQVKDVLLELGQEDRDQDIEPF